MKRIEVASYVFLIFALSTGALYFANRICADAPFLAVLLLMVFAIVLGSSFTCFILRFEE